MFDLLPLNQRLPPALFYIAIWLLLKISRILQLGYKIFEDSDSIIYFCSISRV